MKPSSTVPKVNAKGKMSKLCEPKERFAKLEKPKRHSEFGSKIRKAKKDMAASTGVLKALMTKMVALHEDPNKDAASECGSFDILT